MEKAHINFNNSNFAEINLGIVCPMANENDSAERFVNDIMKRCEDYKFKSVFFFAILDSASKDGTIDILRNLSKQNSALKVIFAPENRCVVDAYMRGYKEALDMKCDWILEIDAGYSHQPSDMAIFFNTMVKGYDCVFGSRFCPGGEFLESKRIRIIISQWGTILTNLLLGTKLSDMTSGFEIFTHDALSRIINNGIYSKGPFFQTEIKTYAHQFKITEVPIKYLRANHNIGTKALYDAFINLWCLFKNRF